MQIPQKRMLHLEEKRKHSPRLWTGVLKSELLLPSILEMMILESGKRKEKIQESLNVAFDGFSRALFTPFHKQHSVGCLMGGGGANVWQYL